MPDGFVANPCIFPYNSACYTMKRALLLVLVVALCLTSGCSSADSSAVSRTASPDSSLPAKPDAPLPPPVSPQPPSVKPNLTFVGAAFDSVVVTDSVSYKAYLYIATAFPEGANESLLEAGQHISAEPLYIKSPDGTIDLTVPKNSRLFALRRSVPNQGFVGKISLVPDRGWCIIDVDS